MRMYHKGSCWGNGKTLKVSFVREVEHAESDCPLDPNPDPAWTNDVKRYAATWEPFANIKFEFVQALGADIRVTFVESPKTSFSEIGRNAGFLTTKPSMWLQKSLVGNERGSVIMHEFGHVLGAGHEHQSPMAAIDWDKRQVGRDYISRNRALTNLYQTDLIEDNVVSVALDPLTQMSPYDPLSIMHYPIPPEYNVDKQTPAIPRNYVLSKIDKAWIAKYYPHPQRKIGTVNFTGTTTPKDRELIPRRRPILEGQSKPNFTYGLVGLDVANSKFYVDNLLAKGKGLASARLDFLETAPDDRTFQVGTFIAKPNKAPNPAIRSEANIDAEADPTAPADRFDHKEKIKFPRVFFKEKPVVIVWISSIDASHTDNTQIKVSTSEITSEGFTLCVKSFDKSNIKSADISWVAYPEDTPGIQTGEIVLSDIVTSNPVKFTDDNFTREAKVLVAVNQIHFAWGERIQFKVAANHITAQGMTLDVGRNVGATYLAIAKIRSVRPS